jgi:hypothetical protein
MPWRCPACQTEIRHNPIEVHPQTGDRYRCHVCRLELAFDESLGGLGITPFEADDAIVAPPLSGERSKTPPSLSRTIQRGKTRPRK